MLLPSFIFLPLQSKIEMGVDFTTVGADFVCMISQQVFHFETVFYTVWQDFLSPYIPASFLDPSCLKRVTGKCNVFKICASSSGKRSYRLHLTHAVNPEKLCLLQVSKARLSFLPPKFGEI